MGVGVQVSALYALRFVREPYRHFADSNKALLSNTTLLLRAASGCTALNSAYPSSAGGLIQPDRSVHNENQTISLDFLEQSCLQKVFPFRADDGCRTASRSGRR